MKKSRNELYTTAGINIVVLNYKDKYRGFDFEGDLLNIWFVSELSESEARDLLRKKEDTTFLLHFGKLEATAWQNMTEGYEVPFDPDEAELIERFFNTDFQPRSFKSRDEMREWGHSSEEKILLDKIFEIWISKVGNPSLCRKLNQK